LAKAAAETPSQKSSAGRYSPRLCCKAASDVPTGILLFYRIFLVVNVFFCLALRQGPIKRWARPLVGSFDWTLTSRLKARARDHRLGDDPCTAQVLGIVGIKPLLGGDQQESAAHGLASANAGQEAVDL
jgi:hypothetical protein